jgi:hypothetical protein
VLAEDSAFRVVVRRKPEFLSVTGVLDAKATPEWSTLTADCEFMVFRAPFALEPFEVPDCCDWPAALLL